MPQDIFIVLVKAVGRYLVVIFNPGLAKNEIIHHLKGCYDSIQIAPQSIFFSLDVHESPQNIAQQIFKIYDSHQK